MTTEAHGNITTSSFRGFRGHPIAKRNACSITNFALFNNA
jgi:hypothetical protein